MAEPTENHLVFACGGAWYAAPSVCASEVVTLPALRRLPEAPKHVLGVFAHRGEIIPVIDAFALSNEASPEDAPRAGRAVLLRSERGAYALTVRAVAGMGPMTGTPAPLSNEGFRKALKGPATVRGREVALVDVEGLFDFLSHSGGGASSTA
jgi:purine-binding chemotaxis protein CheW